jgi:hypothetical protein
MSPSNPNYYLGRIYDPLKNGPTEEPILLDPANLTTHAVVTGMTGSGKTGLCIGLLEEAALHGTPAIIVDPKGDLTNLLLHFPSQLASDFEPWIDPEAARREGKSLTQLAEETAERWKKGLADWGMGVEQLQALTNAADYTIYSPGSNAGVPVNILSSFEAPTISWEENSEILRERISTTVTALLGLIGLTDIDPLRSREHILLSNLIETAWMNGTSLSLTDLILQAQNPPMERLGAFPMDSFFPEKDRFGLALLLNNFLASPSFQVWQQGQPLDIGSLLYTKEGKPRHSIFYLAHLSENERMFFVTLLFAAVESWMRGQRGTGNLRAILYFDEIMGYLPPVANPPSKTVMLRMLKQARAFGVGLLLATQNPVDVDYKALSNAGTWMIGRLQTDQDKQRLLDGLSSAGGTTDVAKLDKMISGLQKRVFLLHSVYKSAPVLFNSRWALNYLAGPMTRDQLSSANKLIKTGVTSPTMAQSVAAPVNGRTTPAVKEGSGLSTSRPAVPGNISEYFLTNNLGISEASAAAGMQGGVASEGIAYRAGILAQAEVRYLSRQYNIEQTSKTSAILDDPGSGLIRWETLVGGEIDKQKLDSQPLPRTQFHPIPTWLADSRKVSDIEKDLLDWLYRSGSLKLKANTQLKVYASPEMTSAEFHQKCREAVDDAIQTEIDKVARTYDTKIIAMQRKIETQELDVKAAANSVSQRRLETLATGGSAVIGMLTGRRRSLSSTISKTRMQSAAKDKLNSEEQTLKQYQDQLLELQKAKEDVVKEVNDKWASVIDDITEVTIRPNKSDIFSDIFAVVWLPYFIVEKDGKKIEIPAFKR